MRYIDAEKLKAEIKRLHKEHSGKYGCDEVGVNLEYLEDFIDSLQQIQPQDKQIIVLTESHGDTNIEWDCRSLEDVMALLKSAESFVSEKLEEKLRGRVSVPDYDTRRWANFIISQQEQPITEGWVEKRKTRECPFRKTLDNNLYGCSRYEGVIYLCDGRCSWIVDYLKLKELKERKQPTPSCKSCGFNENNCPFVLIHGYKLYPNQVCKDYVYSALKEQEQTEMDFQFFAKEMDSLFALPKDMTENTEENPLNWEYAIARHFYELGLNARKEE